MKRLVLIVALLCAQAWGSAITSLVSTASTLNATTYASGSFTPGAAQMLFAGAVCSGTADTGAMSDTQNLGFAEAFALIPFASSANSIYFFVAQRPAAASSMTVTFRIPNDAATGCVVFVGEMSSPTRWGPSAIRQFKTVANHALGTPAITFDNSVLTGNPTVAVIGNSTNPALTATNPPTSWTEQSDTGYATPTTGAEWVSRDSGFTGTTLTWGTSSASAWAGVAVEFDLSATPSTGFYPNCGAGAPCVLQDVQTNYPNELTQGPEWYYTLPNTSLAGNLQIISLFVDNTVTISTVQGTDNAGTSCGSTWTAGPAVNGTLYRLGVFYLLNNPGACTKIHVTASGATTTDPGFFVANYGEVAGIATSSAVDGTSTSSSTSVVVIQPGAITTTQSGDFIWNTVAENPGFNPPTNDAAITAYTPDNASVMMLENNYLNMASQFTIQAASGSINPAIYHDDPGGKEYAYLSAAIAFKASNGAGTMPTSGAIRIVRNVMHNLSVAGPRILFPISGNLTVLNSTSDTAEGYTISAVADTNGNTYNSRAASCTGHTTSDPQTFDAVNVSAQQNNYLSWTQSASPSPWLMIMDVVNADTSAPFDSCVEAHGGPSTAGTDITGASTYTPATAKELVFDLSTMSNGPVCGTTTSPCGSGTIGFIFDGVWDTGMTDASNLSTGDGWQHTYTTTTGALNFGWHMTNTVSTDWHAVAFGYKQLAGASGPPAGPGTVGIGIP